MPRRKVMDVPEGNTVTYDVVTEDGYLMSPFLPKEEDVQNNFDSLPNKKIRQNDILLCSYPKLGSNWLWEMVFMLLNRQSELTVTNKGPSMLEAMPEIFQDQMSSPRLLTTHVKFKYLPKEAKEKKIKFLLICRNPKDTVTSFYNHTKGIEKYQYEGKFENYLEMFMRGEVDFGSYPDYLLEWQQAIRDDPDWHVHVLYYEDLKEDGFAEMKKVCTYLNQDVDDDLLQKLVDNCNIDKMRASKEKFKPTSEFRVKYKGDFNLMRKGQVGDWKNWFTVAKNEKFDDWWAGKSKDIDMFTFRYTTTP